VSKRGITEAEKLLDAIREAGDVWLATGSEIAEAYSKKH